MSPPVIVSVRPSEWTMGDNRNGLPVIVGAVERDGHYFGVAQVVVEGVAEAFEFGVDAEGVKALKAILQSRPFGGSDLGTYRYFFVPSVRRLGAETGQAEFSVRIEQGREGRQFTVTGPQSLVANLMWFFELESREAAGHLRRVEPRRR